MSKKLMSDFPKDTVILMTKEGINEYKRRFGSLPKDRMCFYDTPIVSWKGGFRQMVKDVNKFTMLSEMLTQLQKEDE